MLTLRRLVASFCMLLFFIAAAGPAFAECAGWSMSAADRHACCAHVGELASEASVTDCCAMSEQSNSEATPENQLPPAPVKLLRADFSSAADAFQSLHTGAPISASATHRPVLVPLYLLQLSLLI